MKKNTITEIKKMIFAALSSDKVALPFSASRLADELGLTTAQVTGILRALGAELENSLWLVSRSEWESSSKESMKEKK